MKFAHVHDEDGNCVMVSEDELRNGLDNLEDADEDFLDGEKHTIFNDKNGAHLSFDITKLDHVGRGYKFRIKVYDNISGGCIRVYGRDLVEFRNMLDDVVNVMQENYPEKLG